jgi:hypothetical protein
MHETDSLVAKSEVRALVTTHLAYIRHHPDLVPSACHRQICPLGLPIRRFQRCALNTILYQFCPALPPVMPHTWVGHQSLLDFTVLTAPLKLHWNRYSDGLAGRGSNPGKGKIFLFPTTTLPVRGPTQPPI